jgi:membrane protein
MTVSAESGTVRPPHRRTLLRRLTSWLERARGLRTATAALRERSAAVDTAFETIERDSDIGGAILAGALAYRLFVFALPLSFFLVSASGLLSRVFGVDAGALPRSVGLAGVVTKQVAAAAGSPSNWWIALSSLAVLAYATRVLLRAVSIAHALAWQRSAAAVKVRMRGLAIFGSAVLAQVALGAVVGAVERHSAIGGLITLVLYCVTAGGIWLLISLHVPHGDARWTELLPGSALYGVDVTATAAFNVLVLGWLIASKSKTYGALGIAATVLLAFFFLGRIIIGSAVLNATLHDRRARKAALVHA